MVLKGSKDIVDKSFLFGVGGAFLQLLDRFKELLVVNVFSCQWLRNTDSQIPQFTVTGIITFNFVISKVLF